MVQKIDVLADFIRKITPQPVTGIAALSDNESGNQLCLAQIVCTSPGAQFADQPANKCCIAEPVGWQDFRCGRGSVFNKAEPDKTEFAVQRVEQLISAIHIQEGLNRIFQGAYERNKRVRRGNLSLLQSFLHRRRELIIPVAHGIFQIRCSG